MSANDLLGPVSQESKMLLLDVAQKIREAFNVGAHVNIGVAVAEGSECGVGIEINYKTGGRVRRFLSGREADVLSRLMRECREQHGGLDVPNDPEAQKRANDLLDNFIGAIAQGAEIALAMAGPAASQPSSPVASDAPASKPILH